MGRGSAPGSSQQRRGWARAARRHKSGWANCTSYTTRRRDASRTRTMAQQTLPIRSPPVDESWSAHCSPARWRRRSSRRQGSSSRAGAVIGAVLVAGRSPCHPYAVFSGICVNSDEATPAVQNRLMGHGAGGGANRRPPADMRPTCQHQSHRRAGGGSRAQAPRPASRLACNRSNGG